MNRRFFLLSTAALPLGCASGGRSADLTAPTPPVRPPMLGQSWRYAKHDLFTGALVTTQVDRIAAIDGTIAIDSRTEGSAAAQSAQTAAWGSAWLKKYFTYDKLGAVLPSEVQSPWGKVLVDPHWGQVQVFENPIPLWPTQLQPGWRATFRTQYKTDDSGSTFSWEQRMKAGDWETIHVPAGDFKVLRFVNTIRYRDPDFSRTDSVRRETLWFAPEVGRFVARDSQGSYYLDDSVVDQPYNENSYRWELLEWA